MKTAVQQQVHFAQKHGSYYCAASNMGHRYMVLAQECLGLWTAKPLHNCLQPVCAAKGRVLSCWCSRLKRNLSVLLPEGCWSQVSDPVLGGRLFAKHGAHSIGPSPNSCAEPSTSLVAADQYPKTFDASIHTPMQPSQLYRMRMLSHPRHLSVSCVRQHHSCTCRRLAGA